MRSLRISTVAVARGVKGATTTASPLQCENGLLHSLVLKEELGVNNFYQTEYIW